MEDTCPCGSGRPLAACCGPLIEGAVPAPTAEALMRSRYSAFVLQHTHYILETHHPDTRDAVDRDNVERWSRDSDWLGLQILDSEGGGEDDEEGVLTFVARYKLDGQVHNHRERSSFARHEGQWKFYDVLDEPHEQEQELVPVGPSSDVGRNDPCPCESGKKYKKCCGAAA